MHSNQANLNSARQRRAAPLASAPLVTAPLVTALICTLLCATAAPGCGKSEGEKKAPPNFFPPEPQVPKLDLSDILQPEPEAAAAKTADTWAGKVKELVALAEADLQRCRNEYLIPFQFNSMKRRDVMFVNIGDMDEACELGSKEKKTRGPRRILDQLAKEHIGKHPQLDRFIVLAMEQVETYHVLSWMTKKIGAPDIEVVVDIAQKSQQRVLEAGGQLDRAAADVAKWSDDQVADDDATAMAATLDTAAFKKSLVDAYGPLVGDLATGYERMADKSWQDYNMPKLDTIRAMMAILEKRVQQDRPRLAKLGDQKVQMEFKGFLDGVEAAAKQVAAGYDFYEKKPKDERSERDPNLKKVQAAQKALAKQLSGWGWNAAPK